MCAAFHVSQVRAVGGFRTDVRRGEDGCLAAMVSPFGRIVRVDGSAARAWTVDRRIDIDGGGWRAISQRLRKELPRLPEYLGLRETTPEVDIRLE
jgi:hypothetical protein